MLQEVIKLYTARCKPDNVQGERQEKSNDGCFQAAMLQVANKAKPHGDEGEHRMASQGYDVGDNIHP
jgi:hypothetical protein